MDEIEDFFPLVMTFIACCAAVAFWIIEDNEQMDGNSVTNIVAAVQAFLTRLFDECKRGLAS